MRGGGARVGVCPEGGRAGAQAYEERRRAREAEREEREREKEEAAARAAAEKQAREDAEAAQWMDQIVKEGEGAAADESEQGEVLPSASCLGPFFAGP